MALNYDNDLLVLDFPDTPERKLIDEYHFKRLKLAEKSILVEAQKGNVLAIQSLLKMISEGLDDGVRINKKIANYLSSAFQQIYNGERADLAFGISRSRGQKNTRLARQKAFSIAYFIEETNDLSLEKRFVLAQNKFHVSFDTAKKAWQKNYKEARRILNLNEENFSR